MKCSDIEKQLELFIPKGLAQTDKKENMEISVQSVRWIALFYVENFNKVKEK